MKLYDAIRKGCEITKKATGHLFSNVNGEEVSFNKIKVTNTCAIGAASLIVLDDIRYAKIIILNKYPVLDELVSFDLWPNNEVFDEKRWPATVHNLVLRLNDGVVFKEHSREAIADWLEWLEKEHGYDMSMAVNDDEVEENIVEKNEEVLVYGS